jgi:hypothetical protein
VDQGKTPPADHPGGAAPESVAPSQQSARERRTPCTKRARPLGGTLLSPLSHQVDFGCRQGDGIFLPGRGLGACWRRLVGPHPALRSSALELIQPKRGKQVGGRPHRPADDCPRCERGLRQLPGVGQFGGAGERNPSSLPTSAPAPHGSGPRRIPRECSAPWRDRNEGRPPLD